MSEEQAVKVAVMEERINNLQKTIDTSAAITNEKLDKVLDKLTLTENAANKANERLDNVEPKVNEHEVLKNKGLGIMAFVALLFGAIGSGIGKLLTVMFH